MIRVHTRPSALWVFLVALVAFRGGALQEQQGVELERVEASSRFGPRLSIAEIAHLQQHGEAAVAGLSLGRHIVWGAVIGGSAGLLSGLLVRSALTPTVMTASPRASPFT